MRTIFISFITAFFITAPGGFAQKIEREHRVDQEVLPGRMLEHLKEAYPKKRRVRYYLEENESGTFYEAKFKYEGYLYSVKYYKDGRLFDTEREIKSKAVPTFVRRKMESSLSERLERFKIVRVQEQLQKGKLTGYEVEVKGKSSEHLGYFETHFTEDGSFTDIRTIEQRPNDFLFF